LASGSELDKTAAISSLGDLGDPQAIELLVPFATNPDWQIRYRVVQALAKLGGDRAKSLIEQLTKDEVEAVAQEAKNSL
jgi:HEAT repeat protein